MPAGPRKPNHESGRTNPGSVSGAEGRSGNCDQRCGFSTASTLSLLDFMSGITLLTALNTMFTWPVAVSCTA